MTHFIKLTKPYDESEVIVNANDIRTVRPSKKTDSDWRQGSKSLVFYKDDSNEHFMESYDMIWESLTTDSPAEKLLRAIGGVEDRLSELEQTTRNV